jgi:nucleoside-diphosphate-sugar epimerase
MDLKIADKRIVVTGATGYIGSALVNALKPTNEVHVVARDADSARESLDLHSDQIHGDMLQPGLLVDLFRSIEPAVVFHLATNYEKIDSSSTVVATAQANVTFGSVVLDAASRLDSCDVVISGSHFQFPPDGRFATSFYAATKNALTDIASYFGETRGLRWIQTVFYDIYGPNDPRPKLINMLVRSVLGHVDVALPDPQPLHHFVFIDDALEALVSSAAHLGANSSMSGESVFVTSDELLTPSDVLAVVADVAEIVPIVSPDPFVLPEGAIMVPTSGPRPNGWQPSVTLSDGIRRVIAEADEREKIG